MAQESGDKFQIFVPPCSSWFRRMGKARAVRFDRPDFSWRQNACEGRVLAKPVAVRGLGAHEIADFGGANLQDTVRWVRSHCWIDQSSARMASLTLRNGMRTPRNSSCMVSGSRLRWNTSVFDPAIVPMGMRFMST